MNEDTEKESHLDSSIDLFDNDDDDDSIIEISPPCRSHDIEDDLCDEDNRQPPYNSNPPVMSPMEGRSTDIIDINITDHKDSIDNEIVMDDSLENKDQKFNIPSDSSFIVIGDDNLDLENTTTSEALELSCPFCNVHEKSLYRLEFHIATSHPDIDLHSGSAVDSMLPATTDAVQGICPENSYVCPFCDLCVKHESAFEDHVKTFHSELCDESDVGTSKLQCPLCDFSCSKEKDMELHVLTHSSDSTYYGVSSSSAASGGESDGASCPMCGLVFSDTELLTSHVEQHFSSEKSSGSSSSSSVSQPGSVCGSVSVSNVLKESNHGQHSQKKAKVRGKGVYDKQFEKNLERAVERGEVSVAQYHEMKAEQSQKEGRRGLDGGQTQVAGLIEKLEQLFTQQARPGHSARLCSPTSHFTASYGDKGWGCGYRNIQMMWSCLVRNSNYAHRLSPSGQADVPSIPKVQALIESAWHQGFDVQGCQQLNGKLVNTKKWIGATEIVALLSSLKIRCHLADFHTPSGPDNSHPLLFDWITRYFSQGRPFTPPLYLQHQGHSRTVVGVETGPGHVTKLLLFDPGTPLGQLTKLSGTQSLTWQHMKTFRRASFKSRQYQVVAVTGLLTDAELEESKILKSERVG